MFYDNLVKACRKENCKITPIVAECGGAKGSISNWKKGATPNSDIVAKLAVRLNVSTDFLIFGVEPTVELSEDAEKLLSFYDKIPAKEQQRLIGRAELLAEQSAECQPQPSDNPVITQSGVPEEDPEQGEDRIIYIEAYSLPASAGSGVDLDGCEKEQIAVRETDMTSDANFAIRVSGKSMEPSYHDGDIVLVRTQPEVELGQIGIFTVNDMGYIKQRGKHELISLNRQYDNIPISASDSCYCRGLVIGILDPDDLAD